VGSRSPAPAQTADEATPVHEKPWHDSLSAPANPVCEEKALDTTPARACPAGPKVERISEHGDEQVFEQLQELLLDCGGKCMDCDVGVKFHFVVLEDGSTCDVAVEAVDPPDHAACLRGVILRRTFKGPQGAYRVEGSMIIGRTDCADDD
jgi:hypothetical protein